MFKLLEDLQKQGSEFFKNFENRLLESNTFNILKEKYQSLDLRKQKFIKYALISCVFAFIVYLPVSYLFSSIGSWSDFKQKYSLSLQLLKTRGKGAGLLSQSKEDLKMKINRVIEKYSSDPYEITDTTALFPSAKSVRQVDFSIHLDHLNIKQAVRLGAELMALPQIRLSGISLSENKTYEKHYDMIYSLEAFVSQSDNSRTPVIKRRPVKLKKDSSNPIKKDREELTDEPVPKRKTRKRKAVGDQ